jgi:hypothetical protein
MVYSGAWGKLIREKNQKSKILCHCPFKRNTVLLDEVIIVSHARGAHI